MKKILTICLLMGFSFVLTVQAQTIPKLSNDVLNVVPQSDLIEVVCLKTKYHSGEFFAALDALEEIVVPAIDELKQVGLEVDSFSVAEYRSGAEAKLNAVCSASSYQEAVTAVFNLQSYTQGIRETLKGPNSQIGQQLKQQGQEIKDKIEKELDTWAEGAAEDVARRVEERTAEYASQLQMQLERDVAAIGFRDPSAANSYVQSELAKHRQMTEAQIEIFKIEEAAKMEQEADQRASEIIGYDVDSFKELAEKMENIEAEIYTAIASKVASYEIYNLQAMAKQKEIIMLVLDQKIEEAAAQIREQADLLEEAKLNDPSVKSAQEYINLLNQDKITLASQIEAAVNAGSQTGIETAVNEIKNKWLKIRQDLEQDLAKRQSPRQICSQVVPQIERGQSQIEKAILEMDSAMLEMQQKKSECELSSKPICEIVENIYNQTQAAKTEAQTMLDSMTKASTLCQNPSDSLTKDFLDTMTSLRDSGPILKQKMTVLKAELSQQKKTLEKELAQKPTVAELCQNKELKYGRGELQKKLDQLNGILTRCDQPFNGSPELYSLHISKCNVYKKRSAIFDSAFAQGNSLMSQLENIDNRCVNPNQDLAEMISILKTTRADWENFKATFSEAVTITGFY